MTTKIRVQKWLDVVINLTDFAICCNLNESPVLSDRVGPRRSALEKGGTAHDRF